MSRPILFLRAVAVILAASAVSENLACSSNDENDGAGGAGGAGTAGQSGDAGPGGASGEGGTGGSATIERLPLEWLACETNADCVVVQEKSCRACVTVATNVAHAEDTVTFYEQVRLECPTISSAPCAPKPEVAICVEGECDFEVDCDVMERAQLCTELGKCSSLGGTPCHPVDGGEDFVRVGCFPRVEEVTPGQTCAEDPATGEQLVFISSEIPPGWTTCDLSACSP